MRQATGGTSPITVLEPVQFELDRREVLRLLGYRPRGKSPSPRVEERVDATIPQAYELIEPRGFYAFRHLTVIPDSGPFRGAEQIAYGVCTIGRRLQERVAELSHKGEPLRALILDALGSAIVEAVADVVNAAICRTIEQKDIFTNRRISPGYRSWPIEGQNEIFEILPTRITGVTLGSRYFMDPRKSVSFAVSAGRNVTHSKYVSICAYCNLTSCRYRRLPEAAAD